MIRILQIGLSRNPGGIENCILNYNRQIDHRRFCFDYADLYGNGLAYASDIRSIGGNIFTLSNFKKHPIVNAYQLYKILKKYNYDIVHINMLSAANIIPPMIACRSKSAVIVHCHNAAIPSGLLRKTMNYINVGRLRKLPITKWSCGVKAGKWMWGDSFDPAEVIPNAIDVNVFRRIPNVRSKIRNSCNFAEDDIVVGFVGRLSEQKNVLFIPEILAVLQKKSKKFKLLIVGDGSLHAALEDKICAMHLEDSVFWAGIQKETFMWYQAMDIFILPSLFEGLPVVGIEAQAASLPCFLSNTITDEVNISGTITYLPIDNNHSAEIWANAIVHQIDCSITVPINIPHCYQIQYAVKNLEIRYEKIAATRR